MPSMRPISVCLMFHSARSDNLGVAALTVSQIELLQRVAPRLGVGLNITVLDWKDPREPCVQSDDIQHVSIEGRDMLDPRRALAHMRAADVIFDIGAGDSFTDLYGKRRFRRMIWMKTLARASRTPVVLAPQTFGPFASRSARFWARRTIQSARIISSRDADSVDELRDLGVDGPICMASDLALRLPTAPRTSTTGVGLNVSGLLWNGGYEGYNQFRLSADYREVIVDIIKGLQNQPNAPKIWLVPHVISASQPVEDDLRAAQVVAQAMGGLRIAPAFETPQQAKGFIAQLDFFAGARMHACLAAFSSGVPVVPMAYSQKFSRLFGALGYGRTADCRVDRHTAIVDAVVNGYRDREMLRSEVAMALELGLSRVANYETAVADLLREIAETRHMLSPVPRTQPYIGLPERDNRSGRGASGIH